MSNILVTLKQLMILKNAVYLIRFNSALLDTCTYLIFHKQIISISYNYHRKMGTVPILRIFDNLLILLYGDVYTF